MCSLYNRIVKTFDFFFFQAEDGIRDHCVTGVQTCALPICRRTSRARAFFRSSARTGHKARTRSLRSEERRVGKGVDFGGRGIIKKKNKRIHSKVIPDSRVSLGISVPFSVFYSFLVAVPLQI